MRVERDKIMKMSSKFTCRFCKEQFDVPKGLYKHLQTAHNAGASRDNRTCPICGVLCSKYEGYRDHLLYIHGQTNDGQKLTFKSLNEFLLWKTELEIKHNCKYVLQSAPKVLLTKEKKYFYQCDRSDSKSKDKKDKRAMSVVMKTCSSVISVVEGTGIFRVEYWDTHSGHAETSTVQLTQNELEAAISSVEMVNAIDSEDSFDRSASLILSNNSNSPIVEKPNILQKANLNNFKSSPVSKTIQKSKTSVLTRKIDTAKKPSSNTSILYSLASVACGKGIARKPVDKSKDSKDTSKIIQVDASADASVSETPESEPLTENVISQPASVSTVASTAVTCTVTTVPSVSMTTKTTSTAPQAIAPKITVTNSSTISPLFTSNSAFSNQLVIVNPMNLDQNSMNSGQNILLSLGPLGQNVVPNSTSPQSAALKDSVSSGNASLNKTNVLGNLKTSKIMTSSTNAASSVTSPIASSSTITLPAGINNAPVILSSLPVGSTFMSVNNNLIPIASPSGAFIPTSLPPNIVLTPVLQNSTQICKDTKSIASAVMTPPSSQGRFSTPSTLSITVSSIVREPVYTYSSVKNLNSILTTSISSPLPAPILDSSKVANQGQFKFMPITVASNVSPLTNVSRSATSKLTSNHSLPDSVEIINQSSKKTLTIDSDASESSEEKSLATVPKKNPSARKRITRPLPPINPSSFVIPNTLPAKNICISTSPVAPSVSNLGMKFLNSPLSLTPISSGPSISMKSQQGSKPFNQPLLFESSGEVYMLQPVENEPVVDSTPKIMSYPEISKIVKIDRSVQTTEISNAVALKSKLQRKRAAPPTDDSAVMLKVKCYQLEMKYLSTQTECKRLKVELTKEKLKNAELSGESANVSMEEDRLSESNRNKAQEIMKEIEDKFSGNKDEQHIYTMTKTSVLRSLYEDLEGLCNENGELHKELENYRTHDKFYKNLKKRLDDEDF